VNKLRIPTELHDTYTRCPGATYWIPRDPGQCQEDAASRMQWILRRTMGAPDAFENRRTELKQIFCQNKKDYYQHRLSLLAAGKAPPLSQHEEAENARFNGRERYASEKVLISDEEVMQSYLDLVFPPGIQSNPQGGKTRQELSARGLLLKYIMYGKILCRFEDNLFVHGGVNEYNLGWLAPVSPHRQYEDEISATGAIVRTGVGALGGDVVDILSRPTAAALAAAAEEEGKDCKDEAKDSFEHGDSIHHHSSISRRAAFDGWCSEVNFRAGLELRDFVENTRRFVRGLDSRHPLNDVNGAPTWGKNDYNENYTVNGDASTSPAHWAVTGTYTHPQPGSRLAYQGMAVCPDKTRNPSVIYSSYQDAGMPVNVDKYKGTVTDEKGNIQADGEGAADDSNIAAFLNAREGSLIVNRRTPSPSSVAASKSFNSLGPVDNVSDDDGSSSEDDALPSQPKAALTRAGNTGMPSAGDNAKNFMTPELAHVVVEDLGINRIFCGHQPHGDAPLAFTISCENPDSSSAAKMNAGRSYSHILNAKPKATKHLQIVVGDTSYSANTQWNLAPSLKPKTGASIIWGNDWKALDLDYLKEQNEVRDKKLPDFAEDGDGSQISGYISDLLLAEEKKKEGGNDITTENKFGSQSKNQAKSGTGTNTGAASDAKGGALGLGGVDSFAGEAKARDVFGRPLTPQMLQDIQDREELNARPLDLWNLDAIQPKLNTRGIAVSEVLVYVPHFTGVVDNESVAAAEARRSEVAAAAEGAQSSRVFTHGTLSDGSTYAFEQPDPNPDTAAATAGAGEGEEEYLPPPKDRFLGKATRTGKWVVKATNVHAKSNICVTQKRHLPANAGGDTIGARALVPGHTSTKDKVYLLSRGEGFLFRNKLVAARDMEEEMNQ